MQTDAPIGVFDSGVGGLTVVREIIRQLPSENIVYFGDTARVPYGTKSRDTIINYSEQIVHFLMTKQVKAIVVACNTATSYALDVLKEKIDIPIIGVVQPGALVAANTTKNGRVGVIATEATVGSGIYPSVIHGYNPDIQVTQKACPLLVSLVEEGWTDDPVTDEVIRRYMDSLKKSGVEIKDIKIFMEWCSQGSSTYSKRRDFFLRQKEIVENEIHKLERTLDMINYKCWYYEQAVSDGNEDRLNEMLPDHLPEEIQTMYDRGHAV